MWKALPDRLSSLPLATFVLVSCASFGVSVRVVQENQTTSPTEALQSSSPWKGKELLDFGQPNGTVNCTGVFGREHSCQTIMAMILSQEKEDVYCKLLRGMVKMRLGNRNMDRVVWNKRHKASKPQNTSTCDNDEEAQGDYVLADFKQKMKGMAPSEHPQLWLLSGAIASGKSLFVKRYLDTTMELSVQSNADDLKGRLVGGYEFFSALTNNRKFPKRAHRKASGLRDAIQRMILDRKVDAIIDSNMNFAPRHASPFVGLGYAVRRVFLEVGCGKGFAGCSWEDKDRIGKHRVSHRVSTGGHRASYGNDTTFKALRERALSYSDNCTDIMFVVSQEDQFWRTNKSLFLKDVGMEANPALGSNALDGSFWTAM